MVTLEWLHLYIVFISADKSTTDNEEIEHSNTKQKINSIV